jgi:type IV secretion system protein VirB4
MSTAKQKKKETDSATSFELHEFIPFACHYSERTLITKNSELVQIIKIPFNGSEDDSRFRERLIRALNDNIDPSKFAVWVHNIRNKQKLKTSSVASIAESIDYHWKLCLPTSLKYTNCIYLSIVRDATKINHWAPQNYLRSLILKLESRIRNTHFEINQNELDQVTERFLSEFSDCGATRLDCYEEGGVFYSSALEFIYQTLTLGNNKIELTLNDTSRDLSPRDLVFNNYTGTFTFILNDKRFFGAEISIKDTHNIKAYALQDLLNIDCEMVIYHAIDFAHGNRGLAALKKQERYLNLGKDPDLKKILDISEEDLVEPALQQVSITLINESPQLLQKSITEVTEALSDLGIISFTEDVRVDGIYWSSLPANFSFLRRQDSLPRKSIAALACFGNDKYKSVDDCFFGGPVTFFEGQEGEPYPLHFYRDGQSNTLVISTDHSQTELVANLLTSQASNLGSRILYYDKSGNNENFARAIGASYSTTLDMEKIKSSLSGEKTIIVLGSLEQILQSEGHEFFANFIDTVNDNNAIIIACANYTDDCEALLPNFRTQIYFGGEINPYANHFDIFDDEIDIITFLGNKNLYLKEGYNELIVKFDPSEKLKKLLSTGNLS